VLLGSCFVYNSIGAIDETAIQNLSLVVNITQNIHLKSQGVAKDEDYAEFFPTFIWTVRDFSLQLQDQQGQTIDSKQYLENALKIQSSDPQKNKIRNLLRTFF